MDPGMPGHPHLPHCLELDPPRRDTDKIIIGGGPSRAADFFFRLFPTWCRL